jgi:hypothetical protein
MTDTCGCVCESVAKSADAQQLLRDMKQAECVSVSCTWSLDGNISSVALVDSDRRIWLSGFPYSARGLLQDELVTKVRFREPEIDANNQVDLSHLIAKQWSVARPRTLEEAGDCMPNAVPVPKGERCPLCTATLVYRLYDSFNKL